jgi:hypothetical protein
VPQKKVSEDDSPSVKILSTHVQADCRSIIVGTMAVGGDIKHVYVPYSEVKGAELLALN